MNTAKEMLRFIDRSPCCYHAVQNVQNALKEQGYQCLKECADWKLQTGGKYYVNRNESSVIAFHIPQKMPKGFHITASHSDSPCFKLKESPEMEAEGQYIRMNAEKYGGMMMSTWMDRPLSAAGRIVVCKNNRMESRLVVMDEDLFIIPNVAIHMNRDMNKGMEYNAQTDMLPLYGGMESKGSFIQKAAELAEVRPEDILGSDFFLYIREKGRLFGGRQEFLCAPRLDDLECVYTSAQAMLSTIPGDYINVLAVFDNEEVGSMTRQGAASTFLKDTLERTAAAVMTADSGYHQMVAESFMISADNAHAVHPNHPEKADPVSRPYLNGGIVLKHHGSQKYTTDAWTAAMMRRICQQAKVPVQNYANRSDLAGGSTLGNISAAQVPINTVDIGLPMLAMHSAYETAGSYDVSYMLRALQAFYSA